VNTPLPAGAYTLAVYSRSTVSGNFTGVVQTFTRVAGTVMSVDAPGAGAPVTRPFLLAGWAIDRDASSGTGVDAVLVWAYPTNGSPIFVGWASVGGTRSDVGAIFGSPFTPSGFILTVTSSSLPAADTYVFAVFAHSTVTGTFNQARAVRVTVQ
jgi:hypothetical protein